MVKPRGNEAPPPIVRPQKFGSDKPVGTELKKSILAGVDALRIDKGGKSGGV